MELIDGYNKDNKPTGHIKVNYKIDEYKIQKEEVSEVKYFTIDELKEQEEKNNTDFTFTQWEKDDFYKEMNFLMMITKS